MARLGTFGNRGLFVALLFCETAARIEPPSAAGGLIGVDFDNPGGTKPMNWNQFGGFGIPALASNLIEEAGATTIVDLAINQVGFQTGTNGTAANGATIPTYWQSLAGLGGLTFARGSSPPSSMTFEWQSLLPVQPYDVWVFGLTDSTTAARNHVSITGFGTPIGGNQNLTSGNLWINGQLGNSNSLDSFGLQMYSNSSGRIAIEVTPVFVGGSVGIAGLALRGRFPVTGDFDVDGDVDGNDLLIWQRGQSPTPNSAADLAAWKANFGTIASIASSQSVPEPSGWIIAALAVLCTACTRSGCCSKVARHL